MSESVPAIFEHFCRCGAVFMRGGVLLGSCGSSKSFDCPECGSFWGARPPRLVVVLR